MPLTSTGREQLAVDGGTPVRKTLLPYGRQSIDENDIQAVVETLKSDWLTTGPKVAEFEQALADWVGAKYAVSFSSGTAALHGAAFAAGLGPGDEAITSPMTFAATANCVLYQNATPVFADASFDTLNLDPEQAEQKITTRTKAILPVDYAGHPADLDSFLKFGEKHGLTIIEDACHALGAEYRGRRVGGIAHMTVFSFHPVKHLTTGEGGVVMTNNAQFAEKLRRFRNHGINSDARDRQKSGGWFYEMTFLGFNYRLTDIACAQKRNCCSVHSGLPGSPGSHGPERSCGSKSRMASLPDPAGLVATLDKSRGIFPGVACGKYWRQCPLHPSASASVLS